MKLAHLSDLHFGSQTGSVADDLLSDLNELSPDHVIVTGDLTQRARKREFQQAAEFLAQLPGKVSVIPGNHDIPAINIWERFTRPYARYRKHVSVDINPAFSSPQISILGLNSARRAAWSLNWAGGAINRSQRGRIKDWAVDSPVSSLKVLALHHPVVGFGRGSFTAVAGSKALIETAANEGVDLILTGHAHRVQVSRLCGPTHCLLTAGTSTATSNRLRGEPNAYLMVNVSQEKLELIERVHASQGFRDARRWVFNREDRTLTAIKQASTSGKCSVFNS